MRQIIFVVLLLFGLVKLGSSRQCYRCSGGLQQCNMDGGEVTDNCPNGHDSCSSIVMNSASGMQFFFGCANEIDCQAARSLCWKYMKDNPGVSCNATCCGSDNCVQPYPKTYKPFQCYECTSMDGCDTAQLKTCGEGEDRCFKLTTEVTYKDPNVKVKTYSKGCARQSLCESKKNNLFYKTCPDDESCHMSCCDGDMCNAGSNVMVSAFTLLACAVFAVVRP